ncbi:MAG: ribosome maturation factor RimM [Candidatus Coproplasma sp.]
MEEFLTVAKIVKPQGIRGEVKVISMTDDVEDLTEFTKVYIGGNPYKMLNVRPCGGDCAIVALSGVFDRNSAELLRGLNVEVKRVDAPTLPEGRFYIADVIGCKIVSEDGAEIGTVISITPARSDIYEVEKPDKTHLIFPAAQGVIENIDVEGRVVTLNKKRLAEVGLESK